MVVRDYNPNDFEEVVKMYHSLVVEIYKNHKIKPIQYFYTNVIRWLEFKYDIIITEHNGKITGFALGFIDAMGGIVDDYYQAEIVYVKPKYRKSRSAYLLIHTLVNYADNLGLLIAANASEVTESSKIVNKLGTKTYTHYERLPNESK